MYLIIAPLEVYIGKMLILIKMPNFYMYMCSIQMSLKYVWGIVLIASNLEHRNVGLIQSRVRERAQKGVNEVYFIKTHVLGHLTHFHCKNLTPTAKFIK